MANSIADRRMTINCPAASLPDDAVNRCQTMKNVSWIQRLKCNLTSTLKHKGLFCNLIIKKLKKNS